MKYHVDRLRYDDFSTDHYAYMAKIIGEPNPTCFKDVVEKKNWEATMDEEMLTSYANHTLKLIPLPHDKKVIGCKWIYIVNYNAYGSVSSYKASLVAKGYAHAYGID